MNDSMLKWNSRHVIIALTALTGMFYIRIAVGISDLEVPYWYDTVVWLVGIAVFGHAANKYVDGKAK